MLLKRKMAKSRGQQGWEASLWRLKSWQIIAGIVSTVEVHGICTKWTVKNRNRTVWSEPLLSLSLIFCQELIVLKNPSETLPECQKLQFRSRSGPPFYGSWSWSCYQQMTKVTASSEKVNIYIFESSALSILSLEIGEQQYNDSVIVPWVQSSPLALRSPEHCTVTVSQNAASVNY